jgi:glycosyltransferase involved in cell wall biosynthesis
VEVVRNIPVSENTPSRALDLGGLREISGEILIAYSGRITNHRLLHELVSALSQLRHPVTLILVGYGSAAYVESLRQYALEVQLRLIIVGPVPPDSVIKTLSSTDVIFVGVDPIVRSYALSLPNKYFEALMSDRPVVFPSLPEMFKHAMGFEGTHPFDVDDPFSLRTQLCNAIATVHEGVIFPRRSLGWESEAKVLLAAYSSMLNYGPRETIQ